MLPTLTHKEANIVSKLEKKDSMKIYQPLPKDMQNKEYLTGDKEYHSAEFFVILIENKSLFEFFNCDKIYGRQWALSLKELLVQC